MSLLYRDIVLEVNRAHLPVGWRRVSEVVRLLCRGAVHVLPVEIQEDGSPFHHPSMDWKTWLRRPIRKPERVVYSACQVVAIPEVVIDLTNDYMPKETLPLSLRGLYIRDRGIDQYTGLPVKLADASMDHIVPISRGGPTSWLNLALTSKAINQFKADRTPEEAGLKLIRPPRIPPSMPVSVILDNRHNIPECASFLWY